MKKLRHFVTRLLPDQCDQILQNSTTLAKFKSLWQFLGFNLPSIWQRLEHYYGKTAIGQILIAVNAKCRKIIKPSGHTASHPP